MTPNTIALFAAVCMLIGAVVTIGLLLRKPAPRRNVVQGYPARIPSGRHLPVTRYDERNMGIPDVQE